jgi:hypothetical protein
MQPSEPRGFVNSTLYNELVEEQDEPTSLWIPISIISGCTSGHHCHNDYWLVVVAEVVATEAGVLAAFPRYIPHTSEAYYLAGAGHTFPRWYRMAKL